jgi:hypothetical protein
VTVTNVGGGGSVPFSASASQTWITISPSSGNTPQTVAIGANIAGLAVGVYSGTVMFTSSCGSPPININLTLTVEPSCAVTDSNGNVISTFTQLGLLITPSTALYHTPVPNSIVNAYETLNEGRNAIVMDFNQGDGLYAGKSPCSLGLATVVARHARRDLWARV